MPRTRKVSPISAMDAELALLYEIGLLVQQSPPGKETFENLLKLIGREIDFRAASLYILSPDTGQLSEAASIGRTVDLISFVRFEKGMGFSAWVAQEKRPIILNNLRKSISGTGIRSFLSMPLILKDELIGVLNLAHDQPDSFTEKDLHLMGIIAIEIAVSVERMLFDFRMARKEGELKEINEKLNDFKSNLIELEKVKVNAETFSSINKEISNWLAIIAGNAQFLIMTMKNSHPSITKRLMAIDEAASSIAQISEKIGLDLAPKTGRSANHGGASQPSPFHKLIKIGKHA